jgi:hypothetical protein
MTAFLSLLLGAVTTLLPATAGARIEPSGFATILSVPPSEPESKQPRPRRQNEQGFYASQFHVSEAEARKRIAAQHAIIPEFSRLQARLRRDEADNYIDARLIHEPDWAYVLYFKRKPESTLARYTKNPRFKAALGRYTAAELQAFAKPWADRFTEAGILGGYGTDATGGVVDMMLGASELEYRQLATEKGWGQPQEPIKLSFANDPKFPSVDPAVRHLLRAFGSEPYATVFQLEAAASAKIVLADGCLRVGSDKGPLAYFHRETGIGRDSGGYLALIDRATGKPKGRIGEQFTWAAPNSVPKNDPSAAALKARCGDGEILNIGNPESSALFNARYGLHRRR